MTRHWRSLVAAYTLTCTLLSVAACGGDKGPDAADNHHHCRPAVGVTKNQLDLGLLYSGSGYASDSSVLFRAGVDARLGDQNARGGIQNRKLVYDLQDDGSAPETNFVAGRALAGGGALAILQLSGAPEGSAALLEQQGVPTVNGQTLEPTPTARANAFSYARPAAQAPASSNWGDFIAAHGGRRAVTISVEMSGTMANLARIAATSLRSAGVKVSADLQVPAGLYDPEQFGAQLRDTGADSLIAFVPAATYYQIVAAAHAAGMNLKVALGNPTTYDYNMLAHPPGEIAGAYSFLDYTPFELDSAAHHRFLEAMATYSPQASAMPSGSALIGWISADLLLDGIEAAGPCPTRLGVINGLRAQSRFDAGGLLPAPVDLRGGMAAVRPCYDYVQVNGDGLGFVPVAPLPRCGMILPATT